MRTFKEREISELQVKEGFIVKRCDLGWNLLHPELGGLSTKRNKVLLRIFKTSDAALSLLGRYDVKDTKVQLN